MKLELRAAGLISILFFILNSGCRKDESTILFKSIEPSLIGIDFRNDLLENDSINIIQYLYFYNGAGLAVGDVNNDNLPDIFFASNQGSVKLFINQSFEGKIQFKEVTNEAGFQNIEGWSTGVNMVDVNGDGYLDIYLCQVKYKGIKGKNKLFINKSSENRQLFFKEEAAQYGLNYEGLSTQSAFFDYDLDGDLDMYLLNHSVHTPENYSPSNVREKVDPQGDKLFKNEDGYFIDVTQESGIYSSRIGFGLGLGISDVNKDGYPDIYIGNDFHENDYLYLNNGDQTFKEVINESFGHTSQFSMGLDIADITNDGFVDILTMDMMPENEQVRKSSVPNDDYDIYQFKNDFGYHYQMPRNNLQVFHGFNESDIPLYSEIGQLTGIEDTDWSWSGLFADYNNDGQKDLFVTNGIVRRPNDLDYLNYLSSPLIQNEATDIDIIKQMPEGKVANYLFLNSKDQYFENVSEAIDLNTPGISTGAVYADLDRDGDLDIITNNINSEASILINQTNDQNYIRVTLKGGKLNSRGLGTSISVFAGGELYYSENYNVRGFMSSCSDDLVIGLGSHAIIDSIVVRWNDKDFEKRINVKKGEELSFNYADAQLKNKSINKSTKQLFKRSNIRLNFKHIENRYVDANSEKLIPWLLSTQGPALAVGDVNGDNRDDIYVGGARGQEGGLFIQMATDSFRRSNFDLLSKDAHFEDVDALFFDADADGDADLYVVSGGNEQLKDSPFLMDRLYMNDGSGSFTRNSRALPIITENGSSVSASDFDNDGDQDLVIGSIVLTNNYGNSKGGNILLNNGSGEFRDVTKQIAPDLVDLGMITDIEWADMDSDGDKDIVVVGEWMPVTIFKNENGRFTKEIIENSTGLWRTINISDLDGDNKLDILAGNFGTNSFIAQKGTGMVLGDFDSNVSTEPLLFYTRDNKRYPIAGKDLLTRQMNFFKNLHKDYNSFSSATFDEMFAPVLIKAIKDISLEELESCWFQNSGDLKFQKQQLPLEAQIAPVFGSIVTDLFGSPEKEIILGGNFNEISPYIGRVDASYGTLLFSNGNDQFKHMPAYDKGLVFEGQIRKMELITIGKKDYLIVARNNDTVQLWHINKS